MPIQKMRPGLGFIQYLIHVSLRILIRLEILHTINIKKILKYLKISVNSAELAPEKYFMEKNRKDFRFLIREFPPTSRESDIPGCYEKEKVPGKVLYN